jgi:hypothetical protein
MRADPDGLVLGRAHRPLLHRATDAVTRLAEAGILRQITIIPRNRAFEAPEVIEAFTALERQLASPGGDTRISEPARRVPRRH